MLELFVVYTLRIIHLIIMFKLLHSNLCIGYKMAYFRNTYAADITKHDPSFVFSHLLPRFVIPYFIQPLLCNLYLTVVFKLHSDNFFFIQESFFI